MLLPRGGFPEADFASRRQPGFRDAPSLQLAPIEDRSDELSSRNRDCRGAFTVEEAQQDSRSRLADWRRMKEESSRAAVPKPGFLVDHDWTVGDFSDERECIIGIVARTIGADGQGRIENCRILRQCGNALAKIVHRQARDVDELHVLVDCQKLFLVVTSKGLLLEGIAHDRYPL